MTNNSNIADILGKTCEIKVLVYIRFTYWTFITFFFISFFPSICKILVIVSTYTNGFLTGSA